MDYETVMSTLRYLPDVNTERSLCANITVHSESVVETNESFLVTLTTSDEAVDLLTPNASVTISDDTGKAVADPGGVKAVWTMPYTNCSA